MEAFVEGIGIVGGFGSGIKKFSDALDRGKSPMQSVSFRTADETKELPAFLADTSGLDGYIPKKALRRIDHHAKMALLGAYLALEDAGLPEHDRKGLGIVVATAYGSGNTTFAFLDSFITSSDSYSSPTHFSNSVHNAAAAHISIFLGATGPCLTASQFEMSVASALTTALCWLKEERVERVLFGAVDEYCDVLGYCWHRFFGPDWDNAAIEPFLFDRQSSVLGEGAAFFLLSLKGKAGEGYGIITEVETGYRASVPFPHPDQTLVILGADGHKGCGRHYEQLITKDMNVTSYTPLYGGFPTNAAFDMAVACVSMKERKIYAPPTGVALPSSLKIPDETKNLDVSQICCLKLGPRGESGMITVMRG
jgi:3-oxoacyl-[acyl-carrier-protein] synthase II